MLSISQALSQLAPLISSASPGVTTPSTVAATAPVAPPATSQPQLSQPQLSQPLYNMLQTLSKPGTDPKDPDSFLTSLSQDDAYATNPAAQKAFLNLNSAAKNAQGASDPALVAAAKLAAPYLSQAPSDSDLSPQFSSLASLHKSWIASPFANPPATVPATSLAGSSVTSGSTQPLPGSVAASQPVGSAAASGANPSSPPAGSAATPQTPQSIAAPFTGLTQPQTPATSGIPNILNPNASGPVAPVTPVPAVPAPPVTPTGAVSGSPNIPVFTPYDQTKDPEYQKLQDAQASASAAIAAIKAANLAKANQDIPDKPSHDWSLGDLGGILGGSALSLLGAKATGINPGRTLAGYLGGYQQAANQDVDRSDQLAYQKAQNISGAQVQNAQLDLQDAQNQVGAIQQRIAQRSQLDAMAQNQAILSARAGNTQLANAFGKLSAVKADRNGLMGPGLNDAIADINLTAAQNGTPLSPQQQATIDLMQANAALTDHDARTQYQQQFQLKAGNSARLNATAAINEGAKAYTNFEASNAQGVTPENAPVIQAQLDAIADKYGVDHRLMPEVQMGQTPKTILDLAQAANAGANQAYTSGPKTVNTQAQTANTQANTAFTIGPKTDLTNAQAGLAGLNAKYRGLQINSFPALTQSIIARNIGSAEASGGVATQAGLQGIINAHQIAINEAQAAQKHLAASNNGFAPSHTDANQAVSGPGGLADQYAEWQKVIDRATTAMKPYQDALKGMKNMKGGHPAQISGPIGAQPSPGGSTKLPPPASNPGTIISPG